MKMFQCDREFKSASCHPRTALKAALTPLFLALQCSRSGCRRRSQ